MLATAIIVFREVLEAALIIAVLLSASRGVAGRGRWVAGGVVLGVLGAAIVALFADGIARAFSGTGQALFDAGILLAAVVMLAWHNVWMSSHGRALAAQVKGVGEAVQGGTRPLAALLIITMAAVLREGSELVLFLWAIAASGAPSPGMVTGSLEGLAAGVLVGFLLYQGLLRIPVRHFFAATGWLVLLLAAGLAAQAAGFLNQAGLLPALGTALWDTSGFLSQGSLPGRLLHILVGYTARPMGIQLVFYVTTLAGILALMRVVGRKTRQARRSDAGLREPTSGSLTNSLFK